MQIRQVSADKNIHVKVIYSGGAKKLVQSRWNLQSFCGIKLKKDATEWRSDNKFNINGIK